MNKEVPQADFSGISALSKRFSIDDPPAQAPPSTDTNRHTRNKSHTPHTSHTSPTVPEVQPDSRMARRTYYYSEAVADRLKDAVDELHFRSRGRVSKADALNELINAGVNQLDAIKTELDVQ